MSIITSIILVAVIVIGTAFLAYYMQKGTKPMSEFKMDFDNTKEAQEAADLAKELYNKDLRPIVAKKAPKKEKVEEVIPEGIVEEPVKKETKSEFPIDKPKKKRKYYPKKK
jgi:Sec-independent protein translocase protein TatA